MELQTLAQDDSARTLGLMVAYTLFYATAAWLPLRGTALVYRRIHQAATRKRPVSARP